MLNPFRSMIRILAICDKEILEILRQPRLVWLLIFGPVVIVLLFGTGYRNVEKPLRALFVADKKDPVTAEVYNYAPDLSPDLVFAGVVSDEQKARQYLRERKVDLIVIAPSNASESIRRSEQPSFTLIHDEIDPVRSEAIRLTGEIYVARLTHRLLASVAESDRKQLQHDVRECVDTVHELRKALERADLSTALGHEERLQAMLGSLNRSFRSRMDVMNVDESSAFREILTNFAGIYSQMNRPLVPGK